MGKTKRWFKPAKHCDIVRSSGCLVVRSQKSDRGTVRDWADLNSDILLLILKKLEVIDVVTSARLVCRSWNKLTSSEHMLWRKIDMTDNDYSLPSRTLERTAMIAVDKSEGTLKEFYADGFVTNRLLQYIATSTNSLIRLGLFLCPDVSMKGLMAMAQRTKTLRSLRLVRCFDRDYGFYRFADLIEMLPMLVELEVTLDKYSNLLDLNNIIKPVCQQLKCFRSNSIWYSYWRNISHYAAEYDTRAQYIGKHMHQLQSLHLIGSKMTNKGLVAILEGCPDLEFLDIRHCFNLVLDEDIMAKLLRIRDVRLPDESADDYMRSIDDEDSVCSCCFTPPLYRDKDYDDFYYEDFPTLDEIYGDVMFLY